MNSKILFLLVINSLLFSFLCYDQKSQFKNLTIIPTPESVKITGRYYENNGIIWMVQSGSAVEFYVSARSVTLGINGDNGHFANAEYRPRYAIYIDDILFLNTTMSKRALTIPIYDEDSQKDVKIKIMLLSETMFGNIGISSINIITSNEKPLEKVEDKSISIEFIGDSITCAYGVDAESYNDHFQTLTENFSKSYAYLTAQLLNADYSICAYSGYGIISGYSTGERNAAELIPPIYTLTSKFYEYAFEWDFESHRAHDVIVINLGTNDNNYVNGNAEERDPVFIAEYLNFLKLVRKKNPKSKIICTVGLMGAERMYSLILKAIEQFDDSNVSSFLFDQQNMSDGLGADWHPSAITHQKAAAIMAQKISEVLD